MKTHFYIGLAAVLWLWSSSHSFESPSSLTFLYGTITFVATAFYLHNRYWQKGQPIFPTSQPLPSWKEGLNAAYSEIASLGPFFLAWFVLRSFFLDVFVIPSGSMQPNLWEGDRVLVSRTAYGFKFPCKSSFRIGGRDPKRGDMVCFYPPLEGKNMLYVKRVIGLPGEKVKIDGSKLTVQGVQTDQSGAPVLHTATWELVDPAKTGVHTRDPDISLVSEKLGEAKYCVQFIPKPGFRAQETAKPEEWIIPEGHYFVMGDNRNDSGDSRSFKTVPRENIMGKPLRILWSYEYGTSKGLFNFRFSRWLKKLS